MAFLGFGTRNLYEKRGDDHAKGSNWDDQCDTTVTAEVF